MSSFSEVEGVWSKRLGNLRNVVRQEVIHRQLTDHTATTRTALDVGCGQGTQAIELAANGIEVTGVDPSRPLLDQLAATANERGVTVETHQGTLDDLDRLVGEKTYDLVTAHGLLMYLDDAHTAVATLASRVAEGGTLSITFRNAAALAYRPGLRRQWRQALDAFDATTYVNELGAGARAHTLDDVTAWCEGSGLRVERWYGVRVLTDGASADEMPDQESLADCIAAELEAGRRDPYRHLGSQLHVIARAAG
ncbi:methyltransferase domain-containing protein [Nocardioides sp. NPDC126508]